MTRIEQIFWGWAKYSFMTLGYKPKPEEWHLAEQRLYVCDECAFRKENRCKVCGCNLAAKTLVKDTECPKGKW